MPIPAQANAKHRPLVWLFFVLLALALWFTTRGWHSIILDRHEFRQVQTAAATYWIKAEGFKLDYELPLFGPPWSIPLEFPVYQTIVGYVSRWLGSGLDVTARGVSLGFFLAMLPALYGLAGLLPLDRPRRLLVLGAVLVSPTYLFYARTFMIETTALALCCWFLLAHWRALATGRWTWVAVAIVTGVLAALAKATTFLIFCPPAALIALQHWRRPTPASPRLRCALVSIIPAGLAVAVTVAWVWHSDAIKDSNPFSGFLTSRELTRWNWGTWEQRLSGRFWLEFWRNLSGFVMGAFPLAACLVALPLVDRAHRRIALWCLGFFLFGLLLLSNLFLYHDYYYCSNAVFLLMAAGFLLAGVHANPQLPGMAKAVILALYLVGQLVTYLLGYADYQRRPLPPTPGVATLIKQALPADEVVLIYGWDWNATIPYFSGHRALMVPDGREGEVSVLEDILKQLPPRRIGAMLVRTEALAGSAEFIRWRTDRFGLTAVPVASSQDGDLYVREDLLPAFRRAAPESLPGVKYLLADTGASRFAAAQAVPAADLALDIFAPKPAGGLTQYGMSRADLDGRQILNAHAPSELHFNAPAQARNIVAEFGLLDGAFAGGPAKTDGIGIEILEKLPNGQQRVLYRRMLDPLHQPADRGTQQVSLNEVGPFTGLLVFRFTTGPVGNVTNDWAYWRAIRVE